MTRFEGTHYYVLVRLCTRDEYEYEPESESIMIHLSTMLYDNPAPTSRSLSIHLGYLLIFPFPLTLITPMALRPYDLSAAGIRLFQIPVYIPPHLFLPLVLLCSFLRCHPPLCDTEMRCYSVLMVVGPFFV